MATRGAPGAGAGDRPGSGGRAGGSAPDRSLGHVLACLAPAGSGSPINGAPHQAGESADKNPPPPFHSREWAGFPPKAEGIRCPPPAEGPSRARRLRSVATVPLTGERVAPNPRPGRDRPSARNWPRQANRRRGRGPESPEPDPLGIYPDASRLRPAARVQGGRAKRPGDAGRSAAEGCGRGSPRGRRSAGPGVRDVPGRLGVGPSRAGTARSSAPGWLAPTSRWPIAP
jgi:hypothetical protein